MSGTRAVVVALLAVAGCASLLARSAGAQGARVRVEYDVEFAVQGSLLDRNCAATGTDILVGTLVGFEPAPPDEPNEYFGTLTRFTTISHCGERMTPAGVGVACNVNIQGQGLVDVELTIEAGNRDGWLKYVNRADYGSRWPPRPSATSRSAVTGTCDPAEMAHMQSVYHGGSTAGSPDGQPIEVPALPPSSYPAIFSPNPPRSIWTLTVSRRRP